MAGYKNRINEFIILDDLKELIIKASPCGVIVINNSGQIIGYNDIFKKHHMVKNLSLLNRQVVDIFHHGSPRERQEVPNPLLETLKTGRSFRVEVEIWTDSGASVICRVFTSLLRNRQGKEIGACGVYHDLTPYRTKKRQLEEANRVLAEAGVQLINQHMQTIRAFANAIGARDSYTRWHSEKVAEYAQQICINMGIDAETANMAYLAGLLHDVGKIGVPEAILTKPGRLTDSEFEIIKKHPDIGVNIIGSLQNMKDILRVIKHHHERYDGKGYPGMLAGSDIPVLSRVLAVADAFEAMTSDRSYRSAYPLEKAVAEILNNAGTQFDPLVVQSFMDLIHDQFIK